MLLRVLDPLGLHQFDHGQQWKIPAFQAVRQTTSAATPDLNVHARHDVHSQSLASLALLRLVTESREAMRQVSQIPLLCENLVALVSRGVVDEWV